MKIKIVSTIAILYTWVTIYGQENIYYQTDFNNGIPQDFTLIDNDETPIRPDIYRNLNLNGSWFANEIDAKANYAAFSVSRYSYDFASDNWMITPAVRLGSENTSLRWEAKSVYYDYRESYKVMISTTNNDLSSFKEIYAIDGESYAWKTHIIPLAAYAHQTVYIAFVCTSKNQFILAIDNLYVGEFSEACFDIKNESKQFSGNTGTASVKGRIENIGKTVELRNINCVTPQNTFSQPCNNSLLKPGEETAFDFEIPVTLNEVSHYRLEIEMADGSTFVSHEDSIICSYYPRTLLVEKATANWCNNCPSGNLVSNRLKERLGEEAIFIEVHSADPYSCAPYITGITRWLQAYPSFVYNRESSCVQNSMWEDDVIKKAILIPTTAKVNMQIERSQTDKSLLTIHTQTEFALGYENASGLYRLGYAIVEKSTQGAIQKNTSVLLSNGEYYYLPYNIPGNIYIFHNVAREGNTAFKGVENSLPAEIKPGETYNFTHSLAIPDEFASSDNLFVATFIMNTLTGAILNATRADVSGATNIEKVVTNTQNKITVFKNGETTYAVRFEDIESPYTIELIGLDGRVVEKKAGIPGTQVITIQYPDYKGCYLLRVNQRDYSVTQKVILY